MPATLVEITFEKSNKPNSYWVVESELVTGVKRPRHLGTSAFSDNFYRRFAGDNNKIAKYAAKFDVDLGEDYQTFYQVGMRVSQQLDGHFRDLTMEQYQVLRDNLQERVLSGVLQIKTQQRNTELDQIVADEESKQEISHQDIDRLKTIADQLKTVPFKDYKESRFGVRSFDERSTYISDRDENKGLRENYWQVHPALRVDYLATIKFASLNGLKQDYMEGDEERLRELLAQLGHAHGKAYLDVTQFEMKRDAHKGWQFFNDTLNDVLQLQPEHRTFYFNVMRRAQSSGISRFVDAIPFAAARLLEKRSPETALEITDKAFEIVQRGGKEVEALNYIDSFLVRR